MAEVCFAEKWTLERVREIAGASNGISGGVFVKDDDLIGFTFDDSSGVRYRKDTGKIFGVDFSYDNLVNDNGGSKLDFPDDRGRWTPREMKVEMRPIPPQPTIAETCFVEKWPLAHACEIANAGPSGGVHDDAYDEEDLEGIVTCTFNDHSMVDYRKGDGTIFAIYLTYDTDAGGKLTIPGA